MSKTVKRMGNAKKKKVPVFNWGEVQTQSKPFHPLDFQILEVLCYDPGSVVESIVILEDGIRSKILELWHCHWPQILILISHCIEITFNDNKFPYFDPAIQLWYTEPRFITEHDVTPYF